MREKLKLNPFGLKKLKGKHRNQECSHQWKIQNCIRHILDILMTKQKPKRQFLID